MKKIPTFLALLLSTGLGFAQEAAKPAPLLIENARVAVIGDSITEQKLYSKYIECYLLACTGRKDITVFQFGWSGERADGFANRLANDLAIFRPNVATTCYGMNDGSYQPYNDQIGGNYEANMRRVIAGLKAAGVTKIAVGSPGGVDPDYFTRPTLEGSVYNDTLARLRDIAKKLAAENGLAFANVHDTMMEALPKAKAGLGAAYGPFGGDGFHPAPAGQLLMAQAFLKGLGVDGDIGRISIDLGGAGATASDGHQIVGTPDGAVEIESARWPFCFDASPSEAGSTRSILPYCTFNQDLNRLMLTVKGLSSAKVRVVWSGTAMEFTREQLEKGVNLAAEFPQTPFDASFKSLMDAVAAKQNFETLSIKNLVTNFRAFAEIAKADPEFGAALDTIRKKVGEKHEKLDAAARETLKPVRHTIKIEPLP
jgi:lysophospholipase L1-like esterase